MRRLISIESRTPSEDIKSVLVDNVIGTPGKSMVYQHLRVADKLDAIKGATYLSLRVGGKALGTCCLIPRTVSFGSRDLKVYYIRYFSFRRSFRSSAITSKHLVRKKSALRNEIRSVLDGDRLAISNPMCYAYVDASNVRSKAIIDSFSFEKVGSFKTVFFSRLFPKLCDQVSRLDTADMSLFKSRIKKQYVDHGFVCLDNIGFEEGAFVYRKDGCIVAGLQAHKEHWRIEELPFNKYLIGIISKIPLLNRAFRQDFQFLSIEGFFCEKGFEHTLNPILESALALNQQHTAIACADPRSSFYQQLSGIDGGLIKYFTSEKEIDLVARGDEEILKMMKKRPIYVSGFDNM